MKKIMILMVSLCVFLWCGLTCAQQISVNEIQTWRILSNEPLTIEEATQKIIDMNMSLGADKWRLPTMIECNIMNSQITKLKSFKYNEYYWSSEISDYSPIAICFIDPETDTIPENSYIAMTLPLKAKVLIVNNKVGKIEKKDDNFGCFITSVR